MFQELGPFKVVKCIHLLGNNVGFAADCAGKEFRRLEDGWANFPETERASKEVLSLPMYPELRREQIEFVGQALRAVLRA